MGSDPGDVSARDGARDRPRARRRHRLVVQARRGVRTVPDLQERTLALRVAPRGRRSRLPADVRRPDARSADAEVTLTVGPISTADHLDFVRAQRSVSFLQTPAWGRVKTEWPNESLGWYDGRQLVGAALVLHRPVPRLERFTLAYLSEGPAIDWTGEIDAWLDPLAAYLKAHGAFAIRLGPPVRPNAWSADQVREGIADPGIKRLTELSGQWADPVGARVTSRLTDAAWLPQ